MNRSVLPACVLLMLVSVAVHQSGAQNRVEVGRERRLIPGYNEPNTPPNVPSSEALRASITDPGALREGRIDLNQAIYVRFFDQNRTLPPKYIAILIPGLAVGANNFAVVAGELVRLSNGDAEAWAIEPRSNLLEDTTGMIQAESEATQAAALGALDAYMNHPAGRGGYVANHGFEVSGFMSEWGLDLHLRDFRAIVEQARRAGGAPPPRLFLVGHDFYGASLAAHFAAYNFDGTAGYSLLSGLILLDGTPAPNAPDPRAPRPPSDNAYLNGPVMFGSLAIPGLNVLRDPRQAGDEPFLLTERFNPFRQQLAEIMAELALTDPDGPATVPAPFAPSAPMTNAAALGITLDDEFNNSDDERISVGFLRVPPGGKFTDVATQQPDPEGANPNGFFTAKNLGTDAAGNRILQRWDGLKDLSSIGLAGREPGDLQTVARGLLTGEGRASAASGEANFFEWYYPKRLLLDMLLASNMNPRISAAVAAALTARGGNRITETENSRVNLPILFLHAERGILQVPLIFGGYRAAYGPYLLSLAAQPPNLRFFRDLPDYAHRDVTWSAEPLVPNLIVEFITTGRVN